MANAASPFPSEVSMAEEGMTVDLAARAASPPQGVDASKEGSGGAARRTGKGDALRDDRTVSGHRIALALPPSPEAQILKEVAALDDVEVARVSPTADGSILARLPHPSLVFVPGTDEGLETASRIRALDAGWTGDATVVAVSTELVEHPAVDDWLRSPFTTEYARTRLRSWLLRRPARWSRAPLPEDEGDRLAALRALDLLDTEREERFDRITRLAAAVLGAPLSLVSLLDEDRQWFKSVQGWERSETSRDASFCAHAILDDRPFVVSDASADERFADSPLVTGDPRVRFYAGYPLAAPDGRRVGSLCVMDRRARELTTRELQLLKDLAHLAEEELARSAA